MTQTEISLDRKQWRLALLGTAIMLFSVAAATDALAGIHTWDVREVFSNADGTIQYVELFDAGAGGSETGVGNGSISSSLHSISWSNGAVAPPTNGKSYLIATAGFAALPGAPVPDVIIAPANVPFFDTAGDTVAFGGFDSFVFGAVPTNGTDSFTDVGGVATSGPNTPKNYAGDEGSVNAAGAPVPSSSIPMLLFVAALVSIAGVATLRLQRRSVAVR